jgi:transaldolase
MQDGWTPLHLASAHGYLSVVAFLLHHGANIEAIRYYRKSSIIKGFTTNPSLMTKEKVKDYFSFAKQILSIEKKKPISFEVFADSIEEMKKQACEISSWGKNVFVKIPITNTQGLSTAPLIKHLTDLGIKVNVTAIMTAIQVETIAEVLNSSIGSYNAWHRSR